MPNNPPPPLTELAAAAVQQHELYSAWVDAGFTEDQALQMMIALMISHAGGES